MKRLVVLLSLLVLVGCTSHNSLGPCIGINGEKNPKLTYQLHGWNIAMAIIFVELIVPPIVVIFDELQCPVDVNYKEKSNEKNSM